MTKLFGLLLTVAALMLSSCGRSSSPHAAQGDSTAVKEAGDYYTCPMHPQVHMDKAGVCPICGMDLVKASNSKKMALSGAESGVLVEDRGQLMANVSTVRVASEEVKQTVHAFGTLEIPEPNKTVISARFNGRIEQLYVDAVGANVKQGEPMFDIYSPDIIQASNEYLQALRAGTSSQLGDASLLKSKLLLLGLTDKQIHTLESSNTVPLIITYHSPAAGIIIKKDIVKGVYVSEGSSLYEISDLSALWNIADVGQSDAGYISVGQKATVTTTTYPHETFTGTVSLVYPVANPQTRTVRVRVRVNNTQRKLKPNMYTETVFTRKKGRSLTVPVGAVLITGKRNLVYVRAENENHFEAREVGIGTRFDGKYEITWGLSEGEVVVSEGGYLIDSESQLTSGSGATHQHGGSTTPVNRKEERSKEGSP